eukprot:1673961-Alexandrium_andersonii.AAC.1
MGSGAGPRRAQHGPGSGRAPCRCRCARWGGFLGGHGGPPRHGASGGTRAGQNDPPHTRWGRAGGPTWLDGPGSAS